MPWNLNALGGGLRQLGNQINQGYRLLDSRMGGVLPGGVPRGGSPTPPPGRVAASSRPVGKPPRATGFRVSPKISGAITDQLAPYIPDPPQRRPVASSAAPSNRDAIGTAVRAGLGLTGGAIGTALSLGGSSVQPVRAAANKNLDLWRRGDGTIVGTHNGYTGRWGTAIENGESVLVPWGSVAGTTPGQTRVPERTGGTGGRGVAPGAFSDPVADTVGGILQKLERPGFDKSQRSSRNASTTRSAGTTSRNAASAPAQRPPAPAPATTSFQSGNSQQRVDRFTGASLAPMQAAFTTPGGFANAFDPSNPLQIDRDALIRAAYKGEGLTNKIFDQAEDYSKVLSDGLGTKANGFALAGNLMGTPQQAPAPVATGFAPPVAGPGIVMPEVQPGVIQAAYTSGADLTTAPVMDTADAPEEAAQEFALGALQNQIRRNRLDLR